MNKSKLFEISTEEYDSFQDKSLKMFKNLLNSCDSFYIYHDPEGDIKIVFEENRKESDEERK